MLQHDLEEANDVWTCESQHPTHPVKTGNLRHDLSCFGKCAAVPVQADQHVGSHISGRDLVNEFRLGALISQGTSRDAQQQA